MLDNFVPLGIGPPQSLPVTIASLVFNLTLASALSFNVEAPDGSKTTWSGFITSATTTQLVGGHAWTTTDLTQEGPYFITPVLTAPGGTVDCKPFAIWARDQFAN